MTVYPKLITQYMFFEVVDGETVCQTKCFLLVVTGKKIFIKILNFLEELIAN